MSTIFPSFLNPMSTSSGITFHASNRTFSEAMLRQEMQDLTLDVVIPFLWHRKLSILDGIYETFTVFYGDHFDKNGRGFGQKGVLDFSLLPLLSRKLIADTYLNERKDHYLANTFAWLLALPIRSITLLVALACTIMMIPVIIIATILRCLFSCCDPAGPQWRIPCLPCSGDDGSDDNNGPNDNNPTCPPPPPPHFEHSPLRLSTPMAYTALHVSIHYLQRAGIYTRSNIRALLAEPENLALVYILERLTHITDHEGVAIPPQQVFDLLLQHRNIWTDYRVVDRINHNNLAEFDETTVPIEVLQTPDRVLDSINTRQSTHTASVHRTTSFSAQQLKTIYQDHENDFTETFNWHKKNLNLIPEMIKKYDKKIVGTRSNEDILASVCTAVEKLQTHSHRDAASGVSLSDLLRFCFSALMDSSQWREGVTEDTAMGCWYSTLYEINREYALTAEGVDAGTVGDMKACSGGAFNKLIEGLAKIHKQCEVSFITPATAALKLPCVVRQTLKTYFYYHPEKIADVKEKGLDCIWAEIQPVILQQMKYDFSSIYPENDNSALLALVEAGQDIDLKAYPDLFEQNLNHQHRHCYQVSG